jgi:two-component system chemotaxis response regulator CheY
MEKMKVLLIVDDSTLMRTVLRHALRQAGLEFAEVLEARDGVEALEALARSDIGLVLCDWNMPRMDGLQLVRAVKARGGPPVVLITSETTSARRQEAMESGASGYVTKPFTAEALVAELGKYT